MRIASCLCYRQGFILFYFSQVILLLLLLPGTKYTNAFTLPSSISIAKKNGNNSNSHHRSVLEAAAASSVSSDATTTTTTTTPISFDTFDYNNQWYPVIWSQDLVLNEPTKVTVFDVDYVIAKISSDEVICLLDACPHKGAALSQGRVTTKGTFQCAYHGWSFNGATGACVEIPQIVPPAASSTTTSATKIPSRASATTAVPAQIHQGMVWIFPGGNLEKALLAPPPPNNPDYGDLKLSTVIRDFPHIDWPILVSNIADPDHGLFAHQDKSFDMYSASSQVGFTSFEVKEIGQSWMLQSKIDPRDKVLQVDQTYRDAAADTGTSKKTSKNTKKNKHEDTLATFTFHAPTFISMKRVNQVTNATKFASVFYVCPVGVGRSRFMAGGMSSIQVPRWLNHLVVLNFLDQDTYLLATQQKHVMAREAQELREILLLNEQEQKDDEQQQQQQPMIRLSTRRKMFCLASPTEKIAATIERFWDATLAQSPNRVTNLLKLDESGALLQGPPPRSVVLDRKTQTLDLCRDSQKTVRLCRRIQTWSRRIWIVLAVTKLFGYLQQQGLPLLMSSTPATTGSGPLRVALQLSKPFVLKTWRFIATSFILWMASYLAKKLEHEFYYKLYR